MSSAKHSQIFLNKHLTAKWKHLVARSFTSRPNVIESIIYWKGRKEIIAHFKILNECCLAPTSLKFDCKHIRFLGLGAAIVYTEEILYADRDYEVPFRKYKKGDTDYKWRVDVFEKKNNVWKIVSTQMTLINQTLPLSF